MLAHAYYFGFSKVRYKHKFEAQYKREERERNTKSVMVGEEYEMRKRSELTLGEWERKSGGER